MKTILTYCLMLGLAGTSVFAATNNVPAVAHPIMTASATPGLEPPAKTVAKPKPEVTVGDKALVDQAAIPASELAAFHRIKKDELLTPNTSTVNKNQNQTTAQIFRPVSDQIGDSVVHDTVVTIYPTGR